MSNLIELRQKLEDHLQYRIPQLPSNVLLLLEDVIGESWEDYPKPDRLRLGMLARELIEHGRFDLRFIDKDGSNKCRYQRLAT